MDRKYSEEIVRYPAVNDEGRTCEILERITWGREVQADGSLGEPELVNRRFDLKTGEPSVKAVRAAVTRVLAEPSFTERARALAAEMATYDAPVVGAKLVEDVLA